MKEARSRSPRLPSQPQPRSPRTPSSAGTGEMQREEVAEECHGRSDAHHGLAQEGEDVKKGHRLRVEMEHVDLIVLEHRVEEGREGRNQASLEGLNEDRNLGDCPSHPSVRRGPSCRRSPLVETRGKHGAHLVHGLVVEHPGPAEHRLEGWRRSWRGQKFLPLLGLFRRHGGEAGGAQVRLGGQRRAPRKQGDRKIQAWRRKNNCVRGGAAQPGGFKGSVGKWRRPRPINHHASIEAVGFWGPRCSVLGF